jgi:hypothetical protein
MLGIAYRQGGCNHEYRALPELQTSPPAGGSLWRAHALWFCGQLPHQASTYPSITRSCGDNQTSHINLKDKKFRNRKLRRRRLFPEPNTSQRAQRSLGSPTSD